MITREQVADLQPGDVVELTLAPFPSVVTRGPLRDDLGFLRCGTLPVRLPSGAAGPEIDTLTVVSRAPRPLYVNHPRTEPVPGDVVRSGSPSDNGDASTWVYLPLSTWRMEDGWVCATTKGEVLRVGRSQLPARLRLLVDGETGQVVPS